MLRTSPNPAYRYLVNLRRNLNFYADADTGEFGLDDGTSLNHFWKIVHKADDPSRIRLESFTDNRVLNFDGSRFSLKDSRVPPGPNANFYMDEATMAASGTM